MESIQNLKRRLRGVQNIGQITKAMELVAATKMRRSQEIALASRPYAFAALEFLADISRLRPAFTTYSAEAAPATKARKAAAARQDYGGQARLEEIQLPPLLQKRPAKKTAFVLVTSDKGLAGAFNSSIIRAFREYIWQNGLDIPTMKEKDHFIAVGQKAAVYLEKNIKLCEKFLRIGDFTTIEEVKPIADFLIKGYLEKEWDRVLVFSTHFRSALRQEPLIRQILPVEFENLRQTVKAIIPETGRFAELIREKQIEFFADESKIADYLIEPSPEIVLQELVPHLVLMQIYHLILEANASEHAARRLAMKNASDNAEELSADLTLKYNKSRQASITREIIEVTSSAEALR